MKTLKARLKGEGLRVHHNTVAIGVGHVVVGFQTLSCRDNEDALLREECVCTMKLIFHYRLNSLSHEVYNGQGSLGACNFEDGGPAAPPKVLLVCRVKEGDWVGGYHRSVQKVVA